jgi:hypothetical protein
LVTRKCENRQTSKLFTQKALRSARPRDAGAPAKRYYVTHVTRHQLSAPLTHTRTCAAARFPSCSSRASTDHSESNASAAAGGGGSGGRPSAVAAGAPPSDASPHGGGAVVAVLRAAAGAGVGHAPLGVALTPAALPCAARLGVLLLLAVRGCATATACACVRACVQCALTGACPACLPACLPCACGAHAPWSRATAGSSRHTGVRTQAAHLCRSMGAACRHPTTPPVVNPWAV